MDHKVSILPRILDILDHKVTIIRRILEILEISVFLFSWYLGCSKSVFFYVFCILEILEISFLRFPYAGERAGEEDGTIGNLPWKVET